MISMPTINSRGVNHLIGKIAQYVKQKYHSVKLNLIKWYFCMLEWAEIY